MNSLKKFSYLLTGLIMITSLVAFTNCNKPNGAGEKKEVKAAVVTNETSGGTLKNRAEIDDKYKWNLKDIYESDSQWEQDYKWIEDNVNSFNIFENKLGASAATLLECMKLQDEIGLKLGKVHLYASLGKDLDLAKSDKQAMYEKVLALGNKLSSATSFIRPEVLAIPDAKIKQFLNENEELKVYEHALNELLRIKPHTLPKEQEKLMSYSGMVADVYMTAYKMLTNADIQFPKVKNDKGEEVQLSHGMYYSAMNSLDRDYRERAYKLFYTPFINSKGTLAALYTGSIKDKIFRAKARNYNSTIEAALDKNNIPLSVYKTLVNTVNENLEPLQKWGQLKKKVLKLNELHAYDTYVTLFPSVKKKYSFEQGKEIVIEALKPLGEQYVKDLKFAFDNRWIDVYETKGKRSGAYSSGTVKGVHPYVLLNWTGDLYDVFTLAHEMGHNMHSYYTQNTQPAVYADYPIFLAEVASITNEALLLDYLIKKAETKEEKLSLIETGMNNIKGTFYRQTRFAEFEMLAQAAMEKGEVLTVQKLGELFGEGYQKYWGKDMVVDNEETFSWARIHHFYYNFYVFQYATGLAAAEALASNIINEGQPAVDRYMEFLKSGKSDYAINILKKAGVDMNSPKPILAVVNKMNRLLGEMEKLLAEK